MRGCFLPHLLDMATNPLRHSSMTKRKLISWDTWSCLRFPRRRRRTVVVTVQHPPRLCHKSGLGCSSSFDYLIFRNAGWREEHSITTTVLMNHNSGRFYELADCGPPCSYRLFQSPHTLDPTSTVQQLWPFLDSYSIIRGIIHILPVQCFEVVHAFRVSSKLSKPYGWINQAEVN